MKKLHWTVLLVALFVFCAAIGGALAEDQALAIKDVAVNSYITQPWNGADFVPTNLVDGKDDTCWQVRLRSGMQLSDIFVDLILDKPSDVNEFWIKNGFWRITNGYNQYTRNSRVKKLAVAVLTEGSSDFSEPMVFELENLPNWKDKNKPDSDWLRFDVGQQKNVVKVRLTILEIHKGTRYPDDIAISEVQLMGKISGYSDYTVQFVDQNGYAVSGASIMLMSSEGAKTMTSGVDGCISFSGKPEAYRVFVSTVPDGYEADMLAGYELPKEGGTLRITINHKD